MPWTTASNKIVEQFGDYTAYDGYFIFDADNVIDKNYVKEMNKVLTVAIMSLPVTEIQKL